MSRLKGIESTPVALCRIIGTEYWFRQYWTIRSGVYGHQIVFEGCGPKGYFKGRTTGCGYSKTQDATESCFSEIVGDRVSSNGCDLDYFCRGIQGAHKGGNYYELTLEQIKWEV